MEPLDSEDRIFYTGNGIPRIKRYLKDKGGRLAAPSASPRLLALPPHVSGAKL
jgi:hypothetical protein